MSNKRLKRRNMNRSHSSLRSCFGKFQSYLKHENSQEFRFRMFVAFLFASILLVVIFTRYFFYYVQVITAIDNQIIFVYKNSKMITFLDPKGDDLLRLNYGLNIPNDIEPVNCLSISDSNICLDWEYRALLSAKFSREKFENSFKQQETVTCFKFNWRSYEKYSYLKDCFDMSDSHW